MNLTVIIPLKSICFEFEFNNFVIKVIPLDSFKKRFYLQLAKS